MMIRPMQPKFGIGFTSSDPLSDDMTKGYRYEKVGRHHNYHATAERWDWPVKPVVDGTRIVVDGFSPNLNKELHIGHLRNLALASALQKMMNRQPNTKFVALLGTSLGVKKVAIEEWEKWLRFTGYRPEVYYDTALPTDSVKTRDPDESHLASFGETVCEKGVPQLWDGVNGSVLVKRSDGTPLYAYHDLSFADLVNPTHYITGHEQTEHFKSLDLNDKHRPMGLVLGSDGKKLKSRDGTAMPATEAIKLVTENLQTSNQSIKLAWNVLVWNLLQPARERNVKFESKSWGRTEAPGMYISYTYARTHSALSRSLNHCRWGEFTEVQPAEVRLTDLDIRLLGISEQYLHFFQQALQNFDPSPVANFAHVLAREIGAAYEKEQIKGGRPAFAAAMGHALWRLRHCMKDMGMFLIEEV